MRWVKLTFAPVVRASWLLRICRFTSSSRAGTVRTLVAVGTARLASMLATMRDAAPRSGTGTSPATGSPTPAGAAAVGPVGTACGDGAAAGTVDGAGIADPTDVVGAVEPSWRAGGAAAPAGAER